MKRTYPLLGSLLLMAASPLALAASSVDLAVTGTLVPASCRPTLSHAHINFGKVSSADLDQQQHTAMKPHRQLLTIECAGSTAFGIRAIDNRDGSAHGPAGMNAPLGVGTTQAGEPIGAYSLVVQSAGSSLDAGKPVFLSVRNAAGTQWSPSSTADVAIHTNGELIGLVDRAGVSTGPSLVTRASLSILADAHVAPASGLTLNDEVDFDGHTVLELVYL